MGESSRTPQTTRQSQHREEELPELTLATQTTQQVRRDASLASATLPEDHLQLEIDRMLKNAEEDRHQELMQAATCEAVARADAARRPYRADELPAMVRRARRDPNFYGLAALQMYTGVAQQLSADDYRSWMRDGLEYFNLGPRHPRSKFFRGFLQARILRSRCRALPFQWERVGSSFALVYFCQALGPLFPLAPGRCFLSLWPSVLWPLAGLGSAFVLRVSALLFLTLIGISWFRAWLVSGRSQVQVLPSVIDLGKLWWAPPSIWAVGVVELGSSKIPLGRGK